ncbi:uncharacterized protein LOC127277482 [Leptopilina boulardi]|uniref:uncharacterized protein LOC127277482 n=1 Tax=Leptopilina boulardi TaxID=63433 RepID=UPI0021F665EB|nr:uncharacterized protein LOC127277482 [Leptopilina boulardi]
MRSGNFTSPLEAVQTISIISYLNTLSDFLFISNFLNETDQNQPIPVVNAFFNYLFDDYEEDRSEFIELNFITKQRNVIPRNYKNYNYSTIDYHENRTKIINERKIHLAGILIEGTDLYGGKENEILDPTFVDALYRHLISSLVFEKYTNIYGFLVEIVRSSVDVKINTMYEKINFKLSEEIFLTENGRETKLEDLSVSKIVGEFIVPLLPKSRKEMSLTSLDYIYAAAGSVFLYTTKGNIFLASRDLGLRNSTDQFSNYAVISHAIEQSVISGGIDKSALGIFGLPALLYYVYKEKEMLRTQSTGQIINNSTLRIEAYRMLFSYLNQTFAHVEQAQKNDYRYQFYAALSNFKNRTTLARENIRSKCSTVKDEDLEQEVLKYKNNPNDYQCNTGNGKKLEDINLLYQEQVNSLTNKYIVYETESIREAIGADFIKSVDANKVKISKGLFTYIYDIRDARQFQWVKDSADLFRFEFIDNGTSLYFAVLRDNNEILVMLQNDAISNCSTISSRASFATNYAASTDLASSVNSFASADFASSANFSTSTGSVPNTVIYCNPDAFREKLEMSKYQKFRNNYFPHVKKHKDEKFEVFLKRIAEERASDFKENLAHEGYDQTNSEWWKDFGLSLIPFYTCIQGIRTNHLQEAEFACTVDALFALPLIGEIGYLAEKLTTTISRSILSSVGTTFGSLTLRMTIRETLEKLGSVLVTEAAELSTFFSRETFQNLGLAVFRYIDPGFELIYSIGKGGLKSLVKITNALKKYSHSFESLKKILLETKAKVSDSLLKISSLNNKNVYVNTLSLEKKSGYGYRFLQLPNENIVQIRKVQEYEADIPLVIRQTGTGKINYRAVNIDTGRVKPKILHLQDENSLKPASSVKIRINSFHDTEICTNRRFKRSPINFQCLRNILRSKRQTIERVATEFAQEEKYSLSNEEIRSKLRKFIFPDSGELHINFVKDWGDLIKSGRNTELPSWSKKYELADPTLLEKLRYSDTVDKKEITATEIGERLSAIYPERSYSFTRDADFFKILYTESKAYESVTVEDYNALRDYVGYGYDEIGLNSQAAKQMRGAFYRLAIRQSDDPIEEYAMTLYRGETRSPEIVEKLFFSGNDEIELNRFTSTTTKREIAHQFQIPRRRGKISILYEMKFSEPFMRAKMTRVMQSEAEDETVLLPGSKFHIDNVKKVSVYGKEGLEVQMTFKHQTLKKHEWYIKIMNELEKLKTNEDIPYDTDPS